VTTAGTCGASLTRQEVFAMDLGDWFVLLLIYLPVVAMWVFALVSLFKRTDMSGISRAVWLAVIILLPIIGSLVFVTVHAPGSATTRARDAAFDAGARGAPIR
jgi:hypothetical protein